MTTWLDTHAADKTFLRPLLFQLYLPSVTRWAAWDTPVTAMGYTWAPKPLRLVSSSWNADDVGASATFEIANADGSGLAYFASAKQGSLVSIWEAFLNLPGTSIASAQEVLVCSGLLGTWQAERDTLTVNVDPLCPYAGASIPRRLYTTVDFPRLDPRN